MIQPNAFYWVRLRMLREDGAVIFAAPWAVLQVNRSGLFVINPEAARGFSVEYYDIGPEVIRPALPT